MHVLKCALMIGLSALPCIAQQPTAADQPQKMQIVLEQKVGKTIRVVNPQHVFKSGDLIRFRFTSSFDGFLYVTDQASSGKYLTLFPGEGSGTDNRLVHGKDYLIPATSAWFRIDKPAGYDTIFFVVTPTKLGAASAPPPPPFLAPPPAQPLPEDMLPRCDDGIFRARGECIDATAGAGAVSPGEHLPQPAGSSGGLTPREIVVIRKPDSSVVAPATDGDAPILYQFRIAHR